jgi:rhodanese-related sulfurtransferase
MLIVGFGGAQIGIRWYESKHVETANDRVKSFYNDEMSTIISPINVRSLIDKKDTNYILVDLRTQPEFDAEHIITAINVPAGSMDEKQLLAAFSSLPKDKQIIVYCYSASCTLGRQVGQFLANNGIFVRDMNVGWSEWKYYWGLWNPGQDPNVGKNYVIKSSSQKVTPGGTCTDGKFGC